MNNKALSICWKFWWENRKIVGIKIYIDANSKGATIYTTNIEKDCSELIVKVEKFITDTFDKYSNAYRSNKVIERIISEFRDYSMKNSIDSYKIGE